ncbi:interleukin-1 receptor-like 2 isoform X3 [Sturnira hondurensis]|uniref:interleukin-1 receptor-like 2 isoform X3 n=1 Tax=Sturnira hondurensis TaxID=192404 RepID=UPI00187A7329|nr:interleukin-1 receptor-like 2 isoform X3 [Sturnira hondurensis]
METVSLLLCCVSIALPPWIRADECRDISVQNETPSVNQPFAFNCTYPPLTSGKALVTWYKYPSKIPVSKNMQTRIYQDQNWILFLPLAWGDSGIYQCIINNANMCHRIHINLTVFSETQCVSRNSQVNLSDEYKQILHVGKNDSLTCHLNFPKSCDLDSIKWYKDCKEIKGDRFAYWERKRKLSVSNVSAEDRGNYLCKARLTHAGKQYKVLHRITVNVTENVGHGGIIPKITYPTNNTIEAQLGSTLIVDCNITDTRDNTNLRYWSVSSTLVDIYYKESKRVQEGIETHISFQEHNFYTVNITFLEVKMEDYDHPFTCHAGVSAAYFILKPPVPDFLAYLIGGLLAFAGVAVLVMCIYNIFWIDIALWYRSIFQSPGAIEAVASVIDENIKLCRRLIIIIVSESLGFDLLKNMSEEQIAIYNALIQDGMKVILIEVEKVKNYTVMPESIQYIKQKHGSVHWSGDITEESLCAKTKFWKKVRYCMPPKRFPPSSHA